MAEIKTKKGEVILVDDEDFEWLNQWNWWTRKGYAIAKPDGKNAVRMHRMILGATDDDVFVDHRNGVKLDNRRHNLRACTREENAQNRKRNAGTIVPFKAVTKRARCAGYIARIGFNGRRIYLGHFQTAELAHEFYCLAADMLHGDFARHA